MRKIYGYTLSLDLADCNDNIKDKNLLELFVSELCKEIYMKPYGKPVIVHFGKGHTTGYSLVQLIETSSITGHFTDKHRTAHLDIFSCKKFSPSKATKFCKEYFGGNIVQKKYYKRLMK